MNIARSLCIIVALVVPHERTPAAVWTVGTDPACTYTGLADALDAAAANGPEVDEIRVSPGFQRSGHAGPWLIQDHSVTIRGGFPTCAATSPSGPRTTIVSREAGSLFTISNTRVQRTTVTLERLDLTTPAGSSVRSATAGGALMLRGNIRAIVVDSSLHDFRAASGGAIALRDNPEGAPWIDLRQSEIRGNRANDGGGLHCLGQGTISLAPGATVVGNIADDEGGGIGVEGCSVVMGSRTLLQDNHASHGGGLYGDGGAIVSLQWSDRMRGPRLEGNRARYSGGGVFLGGSGTELLARGVQWIGNRAEPPDVGGEGAALLVGWGARATLLRDAACPATLEGCTRFSQNHAQSGGFPGFPSIVEARAGGRLTISGALFDSNTVVSAGEPGGALVSAQPASTGGSLADVDNSVIRFNRARYLFGAEWSVGDDPSHAGRVRAQSITSGARQFTAILGSQFAPPFVETVLPVDLRASILLGLVPIADPGRVVAGTLDCLLTNVVPGVPATRSIVLASESVFDSATWVPALASPVIDYCDTAGLRPVSTDGRGRPRRDDNPWRHDRHGPLDLGAVERESAPLLVDPG